MKKLKQQISILAQTSSGELFNQGIRLSQELVVGINPDLGLMVMAQSSKPGSIQEKGSLPHRSIQILIDDMLLNLPEAKKNAPKTASISLLTQCLRESIENINEYLISYSERLELEKIEESVALLTIQFEDNKLSLFSSGDLKCYQVNSHELSNLSATQKSQSLLGENKKITCKFIEHEVSQNEILMMTTDSFLNAIGIEFVQTTLSRFNDNLEMAFRQFNSRATRIGLNQIPMIILCQVETSEADPLSWLQKLGIR